MTHSVFTGYGKVVMALNLHRYIRIMCCRLCMKT